jgi:PAS domain S-box-containing protein
VDRIAQGDLDHSISATKGREFAVLERSINTMVSTLKAAITKLQESEVHLKSSEERYRAVIESQNEFVTRFLPDGTYTFVNEAYCRYIGKPCSEIIGHRGPLTEYPRHDKAIITRHLRSLTPENPAASIEHQVLLPGGKLRWQQWNDRAIFDDDGRIIEFQSVGRDITEQKRAEDAVRQSEENYRTLVQNANSIILRLDPRGNVTFFNKYAQDFFGYRADEILGRNAVGTIVPEYNNQGDAMREKILDLAVHPELYISSENENMRRNGERVWISWTNKPISGPSGQISEILCIGNDITRLKQAEGEIRMLNEELERRVLERTAALEAANRELESFSYTVSHDLRAPLRAIDGFSLILIEEFMAGLPPDAQRYLKKVRENTRQMSHLIDDLLNFSRMSRQPLNRKMVSPSRFVNEALEELRGEQTGRTVDIRIGELPDCYADPVLLKQVFVNLLSNALKFTRKREKALIVIDSYRRDHTPVYLIRDNGVGFDMQYADSVFGVFQRLHSTDEYEGTGVGLAIVQRIIQRHGGKIWVLSRVDEGTTFFFTFGGHDGNE